MPTLRLIPLVVLFVCLVAPLTVEGQQPEKVARIGLLYLGSSSHSSSRFTIIRDELRRLGYVEGQAITFEVRWANGRLDHVRDLASELVRARVDGIVTAGSPTIQAIRPIAGNIPIVVATMGDPVGIGFAESLAHRGGNITGLAFESAELHTKRLQLLKEAIPGVSSTIGRAPASKRLEGQW